MRSDFVKEYFSIPNIMGYFRIFLAGLFLVMFNNSLHGGVYWPVFVVIIISGITDFFDGKIARRFNMVTNWGKMLDPIADKITIGAIIISLALKYKIVILLIFLYIIKEGYMATMGIFLIKRGHKIEGAKWYGKVCTFTTYVILIVLLLFEKIPINIVGVLVITNMIIMIFTWGEYVIYHRKIILDESK